MSNKLLLRRVGIAGACIFIALCLAIVGYVVWLSFPQKATEVELQKARAIPEITIRETNTAVVISPQKPRVGLLVYPGARVEANAYTYKMSALAQKGVGVVIAKPLLNFAILDTAKPEVYTNELAEVSEWYVAGHSLGGVKACNVVGSEPDRYKGLVLLGSYCSASVASLGVKVISIAGANDKLSTPAKINANAALLPSQTIFTVLDGMNHAAFGDYGLQSGDGVMEANNDEVRTRIAGLVAAFVGVE